MGVIYAFIGCHLDVIYAFIGCHLCDTIFPGKFIYFLLGTKKLIILQQLFFFATKRHFFNYQEIYQNISNGCHLDVIYAFTGRHLGDTKLYDKRQILIDN